MAKRVACISQGFFLTFLVLAILFSGCRLRDQGENEEVSTEVIHNPRTASGAVDTANMPEISFEKQVYRFGKIPQGEKVDFTIRFTNTGERPLLLSKVEGSCGCTVSQDWPDEPIEEGESGTIQVTYDSEGHRGKQHKTISIVANTAPSTNLIAIEGEVVAPEGMKKNS